MTDPLSISPENHIIPPIRPSPSLSPPPPHAMSYELWCERVVQGGLGSFEDVNFRGAYIFHVSQIVKIFLRLSECLTMSVYDDFSAYLSVYFINKHGGLPMQHAKKK